MSAKIYDYTKICDSVISVDSKVRFAGVINERGRLVAGGMKKNVESIESEKDDEMLFMELALRVKMRKEFDRVFGPVNFALASREKVLNLSFSLNDDILYVVLEPDADYCSLPKKILKIIHS